ncbi:hypothetical protein N0V84_012661 [Fusarium piperis]|uniref:Uncharacterized protein n=1 Tax=Fusarium piperis TaxID=1435070 RepID=A0A9W8T893_9HYPO|nr:hypothetical protein N0V84_012661 [Fusarium piperis]
MAAHARLESAFVLTPTRPRRKRPSFSPVKTPRHQPTLSHRRSLTFTPGGIPRASPSPVRQPHPVASVSTAALEFEEFSYWNEDGFLTNEHVTEPQRTALQIYLRQEYNVTDFLECFPFLLMGCEGGPPSEERRPFSIAGAIAIWKDASDFNFKPIFGDLGQEDEINIDPTMLKGLVHLEVPSQEVILYLANDVFPQCEAISVLWDELVIELPATTDDQHRSRLYDLPSSIDGCPMLLLFHNGPLPNSERRRRVIKPQPRLHESEVYDDTDYVEVDGKFYPGTMISSVGKEGIYNSVTAGVLVQKGDQQRLTCSFHCWQDHYEKYPDRFGKTDADAMNTYKVLQGDNPGSVVGFVHERMGDTDIALAELQDGIVFENKFMEMDVAPKRFLRTTEQKMGDTYIFDSFATGKQRVIGLGTRFTLGWRPPKAHPTLVVPEGAENMMPVNGVKYIAFIQGAFATNSPEIIKQPQIRDSVCGSVLVRSMLAENQRGRQVQEKGEIAAMMHFCDLQSKYSSKAEDYMMYADSFDPLIDAGWTIVQHAEDDAQPEEDSSPSKKRKAG